MRQIRWSVVDLRSHDAPWRDTRFAALESCYQGQYGRLEESGQGCYRHTALGAWAASIPGHVYRFFRELCLEQQRLFIDLGSGDGLVACIAGLFTQAVGIEIDPQLCGRASRAIRELELQARVTVICGDYRNHHVRCADCLYVYPDRPIEHLGALLAGWQGMLLVAGPHFPLHSFVPVKRLTIGRDHLVAYRAVNSEE
jgi:hypothetical protein